MVVGFVYCILLNLFGHGEETGRFRLYLLQWQHLKFGFIVLWHT